MKDLQEKSLSTRKTVEVVLIVVVIFLASLFFFSLGFEEVNLRAVVVALLLTYIILHYWHRKITQIQTVQNPKPEKNQKTSK